MENKNTMIGTIRREKPKIWDVEGKHPLCYPLCFYCGQEPSGAMLKMGGCNAHVPCVIRKLNELLDTEYEGEGEPQEIIGFQKSSRMV